MKKTLLPHNFEFAFAFGILTTLALPYVVTAQNHNELNVAIHNADTTVNGKNMKDLSSAERRDVLKKMDGLNKHFNFTFKADSGIAPGGKKYFSYTLKGDSNRTFTLQGNGSKTLTINGSIDKSVTLTSPNNFSTVVTTVDRQGVISNGEPTHHAFTFSSTGNQLTNGPRGFSLTSNINSSNSQNFSFTNTDKDGVSTHINYTVSDANHEIVKKISGADVADLQISDLTIVPSFSTGKTMLTFSLVAKTAAGVEFKDTDGNILWTGKTSGADFTKSFELPKNGVYYLQVKQAGKVALRRIMKEE